VAACFLWLSSKYGHVNHHPPLSAGTLQPHHASMTAARADASRAPTAKAAEDAALDGAGAGAVAVVGAGLGTCADGDRHVAVVLNRNSQNPIKLPSKF